MKERYHDWSLCWKHNDNLDTIDFDIMIQMFKDFDSDDGCDIAKLPHKYVRCHWLLLQQQMHRVIMIKQILDPMLISIFFLLK